MRRSHNKENEHPWDLGGRGTHRVGRTPLGWEEPPAQHGRSSHASPGCSLHDSGPRGSPLTSTPALQSASHVNAGIA